jgi:hypothetical protein
MIHVISAGARTHLFAGDRTHLFAGAHTHLFFRSVVIT